MATPRLPSDPDGPATLLLRDAREGNADAHERLYALVYEDLHRRAKRVLERESRHPTLSATGLVHEAYLKLAGPAPVPARDRGHFLAIASRAMRQVLVDRARSRNAARRGRDPVRTTLAGLAVPEELPPEDLIALDRAMESLEPRQRQVVECRFFGGLEEEEIAVVLGVTARTVRRDWVKARAWLYRELYGAASEHGGPGGMNG
jgi:RNA polymerase sigma factor (TIGR02999 family)